MTTTLLRNGLVVDGTGATAFEGHVLIDDDRVASIIEAGGAELPHADKTIDVTHRVIAPGFIDLHSHLDWVLPNPSSARLLQPFIEQGVTTVVAGNCGITPAPYRRGTLQHLEKVAAIAIDEPLDYAWDSMAGLLDRFEQAGPSLNVAQLAGHAAVRYAAADTIRGPLHPDQLQACIDEARRCLDAGCCGLSIGLGYDPGMFSPIEEQRAFAELAAEEGKPLAVHLKAYSRISPCYPPRDFRPHNLRALEEMLHVARSTGVRLQLSHFIFVGKRSWPLANDALEMVREARDEGLDVMIDAFPFTCGNTTINAPLPHWFLASLPGAYNSRTARARLALELYLGFGLNGMGFEDMVLMNAGGADRFADLCGLTLQEIGERRGRSALTTMLELSEQSDGHAMILYQGQSGVPGDEDALDSVILDDACLYETDAVVRSTGIANPATLGTFPRILRRYVRERGALRLEEAVRRMTGASAERFGLAGRGRLEPAAWADVVVFDPATISDSPVEENGGKPIGIEHVFINGAHVADAGLAAPTLRAGRVLRT